MIAIFVMRKSQVSQFASAMSKIFSSEYHLLLHTGIFEDIIESNCVELEGDLLAITTDAHRVRYHDHCVYASKNLSKNPNGERKVTLDKTKFDRNLGTITDALVLDQKPDLISMEALYAQFKV